MGSSASFGSKKRPAGKVYRSYGPLARLVTDIYNDVDAGFSTLEASVNAGWPAVKYVHDNSGSNTNFAAAPASADGTALSVGDRILVVNEADAYRHGIYVVEIVGTGANGKWSRSTDLDAISKIQLGDSVWVTSGATKANSEWRVTSLASLVWDTSGTITFTQQTAGTAIPASTVTTANDLIRATGASAVTRVGTTIDRLIGRKTGVASGNVTSLTGSEARSLLLTSSTATTAELIGAGTVGADRLAAGAASEGVNGGDVRFTAAQSAGALSVASVPTLLALSIPDAASGNNDFTAIVGKSLIIDAWFVLEAAGHVGNSYQLVNGTGANAITAATTAAATFAGTITHFAGLDPTHRLLANGATLRVTHVNGGGSTAATIYLLVVPVA